MDSAYLIPENTFSSPPGSSENFITRSLVAQSGHRHDEPLAYAMDIKLDTRLQDQLNHIV
jgi:hypothetical protein